MHAGRTYSLLQTINWTRNYILIFILIASVPTVLYGIVGWTWISIPWLPIALIGTAVAFYLGFKNNSSYERTWEARKIYGGIVNASRTWGIMSKDFVTNDFAEDKLSEPELHSIRERLINRHIAWLAALKVQLREPRDWEHYQKSNIRFRDMFGTTFDPQKITDGITPWLSEKERQYIARKKNKAAQIIALQSKDLRELKTKRYIDDFRHMEMENVLKEFYTLQGKCERIKNFPFPRQYATVNLFFVWLFILLLPFGMVQEFDELGSNFIWLSVPFSVVVSWVFHTMEMIGDYSENPFEGLFNDVPIDTITRGIEIDLLDMLDKEDLPEGLKAEKVFKVLT